jgi:HK97 family phage prohead protease
MPPAAPTIERRATIGLTIREGKPEDGSVGALEGYAAVFDSWSEDLGGFREIIRRGCFAESIRGPMDARALAHHDSSLLLGRQSAGTLKLEEDGKGLRFTLSLPDTTAGRDVLTSIRRRDLTGMSFGFATRDDRWNYRTQDGQGIYERELLAVDLYEVSPVSWPAYVDTSVDARELRGRIMDARLEALGIKSRGRPDLAPAAAPIDPALARRDETIKRHRETMARLIGA